MGATLLGASPVEHAASVCASKLAKQKGGLEALPEEAC